MEENEGRLILYILKSAYNLTAKYIIVLGIIGG